METNTPKQWYKSGKTVEPHYQGLVCEEGTGKTIAVTYDDKGGRKARLVAAAPDLFALVEWAKQARGTGEQWEERARAIISEVEGG